MSTLQKNQIQVISSLFVDNYLIALECMENFTLGYYPDFMSEVNWVSGNCYKLYIDALNDNVNAEDVLNSITNILNNIYAYHNKYAIYENGSIGRIMYRYMNSFLDKTIETLNDFIY